MDLILFGILLAMGLLMLLFAYLIGVKKMVGLLSGINTASAAKRAKMNLTAICRVAGIGLAASGIVFLIGAALALAGISWAAPAAFSVFMLLTWALVLAMQRYDGNNYNDAGRPNRRYWLAVLGISALMVAVFAFTGGLYAATTTSPGVRLDGETLEITGMYGTIIDRRTITGIELLEEPVPFRAKTNGSAVSDAYKGHFTSDLGPVLVYARQSSTPWILLRRSDEKPVLLSLETGEKTKGLYAELQRWLAE